MNRFNLEAFLNAGIDEFERLNRVRLSDEARQEFIRPAMEHEDTVLEELREGKLTTNDLLEKVFEQLALARDISQRDKTWFFNKSRSVLRRPDVINAKDARKSMEEKCAYLFWC